MAETRTPLERLQAIDEVKDQLSPSVAAAIADGAAEIERLQGMILWADRAVGECCGCFNCQGPEGDDWDAEVEALKASDAADASGPAAT